MSKLTNDRRNILKRVSDDDPACLSDITDMIVKMSAPASKLELFDNLSSAKELSRMCRELKKKTDQFYRRVSDIRLEIIKTRKSSN